MRLLVVAPAIWVACDDPSRVSSEVVPEGEPPSPEAPPDGASPLERVCATPEREQARTPSVDVVEELLVGEWWSCGGSVFGTDESGLSFRSDGSWRKLYGEAETDAGTWTTIDTTQVNGPGSFQLNLVDEQRDDVVHAMPVFATEPAKVRLNDVGARRTDYARLTPYPRTPQPLHPATSAPLRLPDRSGLAALRRECSELPDAGGANARPDELRSRLPAVWLACGSASVFGSDELGLELNDDGHFYKLYLAADGGLERGAGFDETGSWRIVESELGPDVRAYLELEVFGSSSLGVHVELMAEPPGIWLGAQGTPRVFYVRAAD